MKFSSKIKEHKFAWGATLLTAPFPAHGEVSIIGSFLGGAQLAATITKTEAPDVVAEMHAAMLLEGTQKHTKDEIKEFLDSIGASLTISADKDRLIFHARVRAVRAEKVLALLNEMLLKPTFPTKELTVLKKRMASEFSLESQNPFAQAGIQLSQLLFTVPHPNRQDSTENSRVAAKKMTREKLVKYHERAIDVSTLRIAIAGNIQEAESKRLVQKYFAKLPRVATKLQQYTPATPSTSKRSVTYIPDKASIEYKIGVTTGITKDHPDYPALVLGLQVLGMSGFSSRLMSTVREKEGLTYGVYAFPAGFSNTDGYCMVSASFAPQLFVQGRAAILREIQLLLDKGVTKKELALYARMYEARSRLACSNSGDLARAAHIIAVENRHPSYLDTFPQRILKLTPHEVHVALKKYLVIDHISESAAGAIKPEDFVI